MLRVVSPSEYGRCTGSALTGCATPITHTTRHCIKVLNVHRQLIPSRTVNIPLSASANDTDALDDAGSRSQVLQPMAVINDSVAAGTDAAPGRRRRDPSATPYTPMHPYEVTFRGHRRADYAPGARVGGPVVVQLARQLKDLMTNPIPGISVAPDENDAMVWQVMVAGPEGTPYMGGWFEVTLTFTNDFPGKQPRARFATKIWHPNVSSGDGYTCVALGESDYWYFDGTRMTADGCSKVRSVACVLVALQMLLSTPNPHSTLNPAAGKQMLTDKSGFEAKARAWTRKYATK